MVPPDSVRAATVSLVSVSVTPLSIATRPPLTMASSIVVAPLTVTVEVSTMVPPDSVRAATVSLVERQRLTAVDRHQAAADDGVLDRGCPAHRHREASTMVPPDSVRAATVSLVELMSRRYQSSPTRR